MAVVIKTETACRFVGTYRRFGETRCPILSVEMCKIRKKLYYVHTLTERDLTPKERGGKENNPVSTNGKKWTKERPF